MLYIIMRKFIDITNHFAELDAWQDGCWVDVVSPDRSDFEFLTKTLNVPEDILTYASDKDERPRIELDDDWVMTILRIPTDSCSEEMDYHTVPIAIICNPTVTVTICFFQNHMIDDFIDHSHTRCLCVESRSSFILHIIYSAAFWFLEYLKKISARVNESTRQLENSVRNSDLMTLMRLQNTLVYFNTSLTGDESLINRLRQVFTDDFDLDFLEDVEIELKQALNTVEVYSQILSGTLDTYASVISNNLNMVMKRMTSVTIVLMIPTLIASFYGMNVPITFPVGDAGFWIIMAIAGILTVIVFLWLKKIRWF